MPKEQNAALAADELVAGDNSLQLCLDGLLLFRQPFLSRGGAAMRFRIHGLNVLFQYETNLRPKSSPSAAGAATPHRYVLKFGVFLKFENKQKVLGHLGPAL